MSLAPTDVMKRAREGAPSAGAASAGLPRQEGAMTEWLLRVFGILAYGFAVSNLFGAWWHDTSRLTLLALLLSESYALVLVLVARRAFARDLQAVSIAATVYAAFFFVLIDPRGTTHLVPEAVGLALQFAGL